MYEVNLLFNLFEHSVIKRFFNKFKSVYTSLSVYRITNSFLNENYKKIKETIDVVINKKKILNIVFDEITNIVSNRVLNISIIISCNVFYYYNLILLRKKESTFILRILVL